jgi:uncharacterized protein YegL
MESAHICLITFDREAKVLLPLTGLVQLKLPEIPPLESSPTNLGEALELMCQLYSKEVVISTRTAKDDWLPLVVVMTDGGPSDTQKFDEMCQLIQSGKYRFARIIGCAAGPKAKVEPLKRFATDVVSLETMDSNSFAKFWAWVSSSFARLSQTIDMNLEVLPPLPEEIKIVL